MINTNILDKLYELNIIDLRVSPSYIKKQAKIIIDKYDLSDYVNKINTSYCSSNFTEGSYMFYSKTININTVLCKEEIAGNYRYKSNGYDDKNRALKVYTLSVLYHELAHAYQDKLLKDKNTKNAIKRVFNDSNELAKYKDLYDEYHDIYPCEHYAEALGKIFLQDYIENYTSYNKKMYFKSIINSILDGYVIFESKVISPAERFYNIYNNQFPIEGLSLNNPRLAINLYMNREHFLKCIKLGTYDSLMLGLPISKELYMEVLNTSYKDDIKTYLKNI